VGSPKFGGKVPTVDESLPLLGGKVPTVDGSLPLLGGRVPTVDGSLPLFGERFATVLHVVAVRRRTQKKPYQGKNLATATKKYSTSASAGNRE
jgi:hypothetical protein